MSSSSASYSDSSEGFEGEFEDWFVTNLDQQMADLNAAMMAEAAPSSTRRRVRRRRKFVDRDREAAADRLYRDYFSERPMYHPDMFRTRYRMRRSLFLKIVERLGEWDPYFTLREDALGRSGLTPLQKCTAAMRQLAYGIVADLVDEYLKLGRTTAVKILEKFCEGIIACYGPEFMRKPTPEDVQRLLAKAEERGMPGMLGSIDCMHWQWRNCPVGHAGQFTRGDIKHPTIILEAVASYDRWIWHAFFGMAGSNNDVNVLNHSPLFNDVVDGYAPTVNFKVNDHDYNYGYYLADGIYPNWPVFMKGIPAPQTQQDQHFTRVQAALRKDVECAFGVLKARFNILSVPGRAYSIQMLSLIMRACVILHNMIIDDERDQDLDNNYETVHSVVGPRVNEGAPPCLAARLQADTDMRSSAQYHQLQADLVQHLYARQH